jgi:hypothetical protein
MGASYGTYSLLRIMYYALLRIITHYYAFLRIINVLFHNLLLTGASYGPLFWLESLDRVTLIQ